MSKQASKPSNSASTTSEDIRTFNIFEAGMAPACNPLAAMLITTPKGRTKSNFQLILTTFFTIFG